MATSQEIKKIEATTAKLKELGVIIGIAASVLFGALSFFKESDSSKEEIKELSSQIKEVSKDVNTLQKEMASINGYLDAKKEQDKRQVLGMPE